jgi:hypothetical protein
VVDELCASLDAYWEPERRLVEDGYAGVEVPFIELETPAFEMRSWWSIDELIGYLGTWSALQKCMAAQGRNPLDDVRPRLVSAWGSEGRREAVWPLAVRAFRMGAESAADRPVVLRYE